MIEVNIEYYVAVFETSHWFIRENKINKTGQTFKK